MADPPRHHSLHRAGATRRYGLAPQQAKDPRRAEVTECHSATAVKVVAECTNRKQPPCDVGSVCTARLASCARPVIQRLGNEVTESANRRATILHCAVRLLTWSTTQLLFIKGHFVTRRCWSGLPSNQLLEGELEMGSESVTTSNSADGTSIWYHGPSLCVQANLKRRESDKERQLQDEPLLKKWPRVSGVERGQLLAGGLKLPQDSKPLGTSELKCKWLVLTSSSRWLEEDPSIEASAPSGTKYQHFHVPRCLIYRLIQGGGLECGWGYPPKWLGTPGRKFFVAERMWMHECRWAKQRKIQKVGKVEAHELRVCLKTKAPA